jgi:hypothetical protein
LLHGGKRGRDFPSPHLLCGRNITTNGNRACSVKHAVEYRDADGGFRLLRRQITCARADQRFVAAHGHLDQRTPPAREDLHLKDCAHAKRAIEKPGKITCRAFSTNTLSLKRHVRRICRDREAEVHIPSEEERQPEVEQRRERTDTCSQSVKRVVRAAGRERLRIVHREIHRARGAA